MLTLDQTTLFYFSLRDAINCDKDKSGLVHNWASRIQPNTKAHSKPTSIQNSASTPFLTHTSSQTSQSTLSRDVKVTEDVEVASATGGLSDHDETFGEERDAEFKSPPKAGRHITSEVSHIVSCTHMH